MIYLDFLQKQKFLKYFVSTSTIHAINGMIDSSNNEIKSCNNYMRLNELFKNPKISQYD